MTPLSRRRFLESSAAAGAVLLAAPYGRTAGAGEKLNIGLIGSGNRGTTLLKEAIKLEHNAVAICATARRPCC